MLACLSTLDKNCTNKTGKNEFEYSMKMLHSEKLLSFVALCYLKLYYVCSMKIFAEDFFI